MVKKTAFKVGKFVKKKIDDKDFVLAKLSGKCSGKQMREIRAALNACIIQVLNKDEDSDE